MKIKGEIDETTGLPLKSDTVFVGLYDSGKYRYGTYATREDACYFIYEKLKARNNSVEIVEVPIRDVADVFGNVIKRGEDGTHYIASLRDYENDDHVWRRAR